jgi:siroheme synthase
MIESGTTIALYMPGADPRETVDKLAAAGIPREAPCAVVSRASTSAQQTTITNLWKLPSVGAQAKPSILILGDVVRLSKLSHLDFQSLSAELLPAQNSDRSPEANRA